MRPLAIDGVLSPPPRALAFQESGYAVLGPFLEQAGFLGVGSAFRPMPLRPVELTAESLVGEGRGDQGESERTTDVLGA